MKRMLFLACLISLIASCNDKEEPDVSNIPVTLSTIRFEQDFFSMDTNNLSASLDIIYNKYPGFFRDFSQNILGLPPITDSGNRVLDAIRQFLRDYRPVYDSVNKQFPNLRPYENELVKGLKHVKYYFPSYTLPTRLITFIGPMDAFFQGSTGGYGDVITSDGLAIGLQLHLGSNFSMYTSEMGLSLFPAYISRKFAPEYIPVNSIKNIIDDLYPDQSSDKTLVEQMIERGKRIYLIDKLMPDTHDTLKIGYTSSQLNGCIQNERMIWNYFVKNGLVFNNDPSLIKNYIGDAPNTPEFGEGAPGNIGLFVGWRIVQQYMDNHASMSLDELMKIDPKKLFEESKYRPG